MKRGRLLLSELLLLFSWRLVLPPPLSLVTSQLRNFTHVLPNTDDYRSVQLVRCSDAPQDLRCSLSPRALRSETPFLTKASSKIASL